MRRPRTPRSLTDLPPGQGRREVLAGLLLTALLVPAGMGYAAVSGLPPITGLYATIGGLIAYAAFAPASIVVVGPDASVAPLVAAAVLPLAAVGSDRAAGLAGVLAVLVGLILVTGSRLRLGRVVQLLSKPIRLGYLHGIAVVILVGQADTLLGIDVDRGGVLDELRALATGLVHGETTAAAVGVGGLAAILVVRARWPRFPATLAAVVASTVLTVLLDLEIPVVGELPRELPSPFTGVRWDDLGRLVPAAFGIAVVALADTAAVARTLGRQRAPADGDGAMLGLGAANVGAALVGGFPVSGSMTRTAVLETSGARTPVAALVGAAGTLAIVALVPGLLANVPTATLAAVVIAAVISVIDLRALDRLRRMSTIDFALAMTTAVGVVVAGALAGIGIAVVLSLGAFIARAWRPYTAELVRVEHRKGYHDVARHPDGRRVPGLAIVRFDAPLFFANAEPFAAFVRETVAHAAAPVRSVLVAAEPITDVDVTAAEVLVELARELNERDIELVFAELKGPVADKLARMGVLEQVTGGPIYPTLGTAISAYVRRAHVAWHDWSDEVEPTTDDPGGAEPDLTL